jgi:hypothetical protein
MWITKTSRWTNLNASSTLGLIILCRSQQEAQEALEQVQRWVEENGLQLHPTKTRLVNANLAGGFDFLGYHFERGMK